MKNNTSWIAWMLAVWLCEMFGKSYKLAHRLFFSCTAVYSNLSFISGWSLHSQSCTAGYINDRRWTHLCHTTHMQSVYYVNTVNAQSWCFASRPWSRRSLQRHALNNPPTYCFAISRPLPVVFVMSLAPFARDVPNQQLFCPLILLNRCDKNCQPRESVISPFHCIFCLFYPSASSSSTSLRPHTDNIYSQQSKDIFSVCILSKW